MARATIKNAAADETPSAQMVKNSTVTITDKRGRQIVLRHVRGARKLRLFDVIGDSANNKVYLSHALLAASVASIDDVPYNITSKMQIEALLDRVDDDEGTIELIAETYQKTWQVAEAEVIETAKK